jgi:hypothetical protein
MNALGLVSLAGMAVTGAALLAMRLEARLGGADSPFVRWVKAPLDAVSFAVRTRLRITRGPYVLAHEAKDSLFAYLDADGAARAYAREAVLRQRYDLDAYAAHSTQDDYREVLYHLDVLDELGALPELRPQAGAASLRALDVGSKDFRYALAIERWITRKTRQNVQLRGVEIDGNGVYRNLYTRRDRAEAYCRAVGPHVAFDVHDFLTYASPTLDLLTVFFPFVLPFALVAWGLPMGTFAPEKFFARYKELVRPGGLLLIANQSAEEKARAIELLEAVGGFRLLVAQPMRSTLVNYQAEIDERHVHLWVREA